MFGLAFNTTNLLLFVTLAAKSRGLKWRSILIVFVFGTMISQAQGNLSDLDQEYFQLITRFYSTNVDKKSNQKFKDIEAFKKHIDKRLTASHTESALSDILLHQTLIADNLDSNEAIDLINVLLNEDLSQPAISLIEDNIEFSNVFTAAKLHYLLASFYFYNDQMNQSVKHVAAIETEEALSPEQKDFSLIMYGIALQEKRKHRDAIHFYRKIKPNSYYYGYAKLNEAVGLIRQGWWTDAHIAIEQALETPFPDELKDLSNRLLLIMAYSQIQNEFYRNARKTLRRISLDSEYIDQALLGLGLCALNQKDYIGAINAFTRLQDNGGDSLPVQETYLLIPISYERMRDLDTSSSFYTRALNHFETQKKLWEKKLLDVKTTQANQLDSNHYQQLSSNIVRRINRLEKLSTLANGPLKSQVNQLLLKYKENARSSLLDKLEATLSHLDSYQNQAQYGLAKLYDNN